MGVVETYAHKGVQSTSITLGCMVEALVTNCCTEEACLLVQDLREEEEQMQLVNTVIHSTIHQGFVLSKQHERVMAFFSMRCETAACTARCCTVRWFGGRMESFNIHQSV